MSSRTLEEQLTKYLTDAHSIEEQALTQLRAAPKIAGEQELQRIFEEHLRETEDQERTVRELLAQHGGSPARPKDLAGKAGGFAFVLFARFQPDTPGKLTAHAYSYEHLELAAYELLSRIADRAGATETAEAARRIREQERSMASRLAACFDIAVEASLREVEPDSLGEQLNKYLADAHAIESQAIQLLEKGPEIVAEGALATVFAEHLEETRSQQRLIGERLEARGASPSALKDAVMRTGALNWGAFFAAQPDTPAKLAGFAFAFEHLEIAGYEELSRVADRAGDADTALAATRILDQEREAADRISARFDDAIDASLEALDVEAAAASHRES